jgi:hypothetical protein
MSRRGQGWYASRDMLRVRRPRNARADIYDWMPIIFLLAKALFFVVLVLFALSR